MPHLTTDRSKVTAPIQLFLTPDERHQLRLKAVNDKETMQSALRRLTHLYINGELPQAEPQGHESR